MTELPTKYGPLLVALHERAALCHQPINGTFELTSRCNLACRMCYIRHPANDREVKERELSAGAWLDLARDAVANGMVFLLLTGGEIFLRRDFFDIYEPLTHMGLVITLYTNGSLVTKEIARRLAEIPPSSTDITLYGATAATYDSITGVSGSCESCCAGIEILLAHGVPLALRATITEQNMGEFEAMQQMAENWGVPFSADWILSKRRDGAPSDVENCRVSPSDCAKLATLNATSSKGQIEAPLSEVPPPDGNANFYCNAGQVSFVVSPAGEMNVCMDLAMPKARPLDIGFHEAWEQVRDFVASVPPVSQTCIDCDVRDYCPRCPAWSSLETQLLTEPVPYLCNIARAMKER